MLQLQTVAKAATNTRLAVALASSKSEIIEAQRLRYQVFAEEQGARLQTGRAGIDEDRFDAYCDHLIVRDLSTDEVVGTYRVLSPQAALAIGGYYSEQEFDLSRLAPLRAGLVEVGRSCIHASYRTGAAIGLLWSGLARYMREGGYSHVVGCASISMADGGHAAANLYRRLGAAHLSPREYRVFPRCHLPFGALADHGECYVPPLIKGYLRLGAYICGEPAWDPDFNTADLLMLLSMARMDSRYGRHYLRGDVRAA
ncbi:MAG TPA: GNAT family N-acyltransferase [Burkholderiales bacterium]|jgi:Putative hemolysin